MLEKEDEMDCIVHGANFLLKVTPLPPIPRNRRTNCCSKAIAPLLLATPHAGNMSTSSAMHRSAVLPPLMPHVWLLPHLPLVSCCRHCRVKCLPSLMGSRPLWITRLMRTSFSHTCWSISAQVLALSKLKARGNLSA